jgi:Ca2+-transporting ATPase
VESAAEGTEGVELANRLFGESGLRVLAVATRDLDPSSFDPAGDLIGQVAELQLLGLYGIVDPPRPEAREAIAVARDAGIRVRMITGDHAVTAKAIAGELGIEGEAVTGADLDRMDDAELASRVDQIGVFGRVAPEHKVRLVTTLRDRGQVVAMTGDGVNDAPALKTADIGVAMGITGTEVSKQAARMVLTDDNFATIVESVGIGRSIYDNLMKYVRFQTASLASFVTVFVGATLLDIADGAPLNPIQILWVNFVVTSVLAIALGFDTPPPDLMRRRPRDPSRAVLDRLRIIRLGLQGVMIGVVTLLAVGLSPDNAVIGQASIAGTMALVTMSLGTVVAAIVNRDEIGSFFTSHPFANPRFNRSVLVAIGATLLATELGFLQNWMLTVPLTAKQWMWALLGALIVFGVDEVRKLIERRMDTTGAT